MRTIWPTANVNKTKLNKGQTINVWRQEIRNYLQENKDRATCLILHQNCNLPLCLTMDEMDEPTFHHLKEFDGNLELSL